MGNDFRYWIVSTNGSQDWRSGDLTGELIRCMDCVHQRKNRYIPNGYCDRFEEYEPPLGEDFNFCSKAERKIDDNSLSIGDSFKR